MIEILVRFSMYFAFCLFLDGLETIFDKETHWIFKAVRILYPLFIVGTLFCLLISGEVK